jgi:hypothetical protein
VCDTCLERYWAGQWFCPKCEREEEEVSVVDNEILNDCKWYADKHRGKNVKSGPHWSTVIRFTPLFDEAVRLQQRVDTLERYISDYCSSAEVE